MIYKIKLSLKKNKYCYNLITEYESMIQCLKVITDDTKLIFVNIFV